MINIKINVHVDLTSKALEVAVEGVDKDTAVDVGVSSDEEAPGVETYNSEPAARMSLPVTGETKEPPAAEEPAVEKTEETQTTEEPAEETTKEEEKTVEEEKKS